MEDLTKSWNRLSLHEGESKGLQLQPNTIRAWYGGPISLHSGVSIYCCLTGGCSFWKWEYWLLWNFRKKKFNESNVLDSNGQALPTPRVNPLFSSTINHEELFLEKLTEIDQDISCFDKNVAEIGEINISQTEGWKTCCCSLHNYQWWPIYPRVYYTTWLPTSPTHKFCSPHKLKRKSRSLTVHVLHLQTLVRGRVWLVGLHLRTQRWVKVFSQSVPFWHLMLTESYLASFVWFLQVVLKTSWYWQRLMVDPARSYMSILIWNWCGLGNLQIV